MGRRRAVRRLVHRGRSARPMVEVAARRWSPPRGPMRSRVCASYGCLLLSDRQLLPASALRGLQNGVGHVIGGETIAERRRRALPAGGRVQEIGELMDERVLVSDLKSGDPPMFHVGMIAVGDVNAAPPAQLALVLVIEPLEPVEIVEIP